MGLILFREARRSSLANCFKVVARISLLLSTTKPMPPTRSIGHLVHLNCRFSSAVFSQSVDIIPAINPMRANGKTFLVIILQLHMFDVYICDYSWQLGKTDLHSFAISLRSSSLVFPSFC
jgi:hypothetical protein